MLLRRHYRTRPKFTEKVTEPIVEEEIVNVKYPDVDDITKREIMEILKEKGLEFKPADNKDTLYKIMIES